MSYSRKILILAAAVLLISCGEQKVEHDFTQADILFLQQFSLSSLADAPNSKSNSVASDLNAAKLGHQLFFDKRLSANGEVACSHCHQPEKYFTDGLKTSVAIGTAKRNAPSVLSASWSHWMYWDGRKDSVWSQALGPLEDPAEHGFTRVKVVKSIAKNYSQSYEAIFGKILADELLASLPDDATPIGSEQQKQLWQQIDPQIQQEVNQAFANVGKSLMAYQRQLKTPLARFDHYVDALVADNLTTANQLNDSELNGMKLFLGRANCVSCHNGPLFTNFEFHNIGAPESDKNNVDLGRYSGIKSLVADEFTCLSSYSDAKPEDCMEMRFLKKQGPELVGAFKTPSLRNVAKTAPYMQTGQFDTLEQVIEHYDIPKPPYYNRQQHPNRPHFDILALNLKPQEKLDLMAFLHTLTSPIPKDDEWWQEPKPKD